MRNLFLLLGFSVLFFSCNMVDNTEAKNEAATDEESINLEDYGDPAIISFHAEQAEVISDTSGKQMLVLTNTSILATISAAVHKHNQRLFNAFPVDSLPAVWNSCNAMKFEYELFHEDGVNSVFTFDEGPEMVLEHGHLSNAPLITQTAKVSKTTGGSEGTIYAMLIDAAGNRNKLSFVIEGAQLSEGLYSEVQMSTECVVGVSDYAGALAVPNSN